MLSLFIFVGFSGFSMTAKATIHQNGKGSAVLNVVSEKTEKEFKKDLKEKLDGFNIISGDNDMLQLKSLKKTSDGFSVEISFRRIDKIKVMGDFKFAKFSSYVSEGSMTLAELDKWYKGNISGTVSAYYDGQLGKINVPRSSNNIKVKPYTVSGKELTYEQFVEVGEKADRNDTIFSFRLFDIGNVVKARVSFPGKITHYGGENVTVIGDDTIEVTPTLVDATVTKNKIETVDGVDKIVPEVIVGDIGCMVGYVVFEKSLSPLMIGLIVVVSALIIGLITFVIVHMIKKGKRILREREEKPSKNSPSTITPSFVLPKTDGGNASEEGTLVMAKTVALKKESPLKVGWQAVVKSRTWQGIKRHKLLYLLFLPAFVLTLIFSYAPMFGLFIAFEDYRLTEGVFGSEFIGFKAFHKILFSQTASYTAYRNTIYISLIRIATNFPIILIFTLLLNEIKTRKAKGLIQTISYIPNFISWIAVGGMSYNLFSANDGLINKVIEAFGGTPVVWYNDPDPWWGILAISSLWKGMGWSTLIYMSAIGSIDDELYDACTIDGGGKFRQAITVTLPGLMNVIIFQVIMDIGGIMSDNYDQILAMINGSDALASTTQVVGMVEYNAILHGDGYTTATAMGLIRGIIGLILVLTANKVAKKTDNEGIL